MQADLIRKELSSLLPLLVIATVCYALALILLTLILPAISPAIIYDLDWEGDPLPWHWGLYPPFVNYWLNTVLFLFNLFLATALAFWQTNPSDATVEPTCTASGWRAFTLLRIVVGTGVFLVFNLILIGVVAVHSAWPGVKPFPFSWDIVVDSLRVPLSGLALYMAMYWLRLRTARGCGSGCLAWLLIFILACLSINSLLVGLGVIAWTLMTLFFESTQITFDSVNQEAPPNHSRISLSPNGILFGLGCVPFLLVLLFIGVITRPTMQSGYSDQSERLFLQPDGRFLVKTRDMNLSDSMPYRDLLSGQEITPSRPGFLDSGTVLLPRQNKYNRSRPWRYRVREMSGPAKARTLWYLVHDGEKNGHAVLMGYDVESCRLAGYLGPEGFSETVPPVSKQFTIKRTERDPLYSRVFFAKVNYLPEQHWIGVNFIWAEDGIYRLETTRQEVSQIVTWASGEHVLSMEENLGWISEQRCRLYACTTKRVVEIKLDGTILEIPLPSALQNVQHLEIFSVGETGPVLNSQSLITNATNEVSVLHRIYRFNKVGILDTTHEVSLAN